MVGTTGLEPATSDVCSRRPGITRLVAAAKHASLRHIFRRDYLKKIRRIAMRLPKTRLRAGGKILTRPALNKRGQVKVFRGFAGGRIRTHDRGGIG